MLPLFAQAYTSGNYFKFGLKTARRLKPFHSNRNGEDNKSIFNRKITFVNTDTINYSSQREKVNGLQNGKQQTKSD